ncbi:putative endonuclease [Tangfeifania diversioriginum]|uniref:Putative endonuclease n=1 Tax=Tangfeifania diversioriginum TaxID=1168035 RepID=A0A1M6KH03_9BACT|nr:putative endonuclease [Tangfeifania diversioriginum]
MSASCYILFSEKLNKFYVGATNDNVEKRLEKHNDHSYGKHRYTAMANDWEVFLSIEANDYPHAIRMERKIKSMKSKIFIRNLKQYPELQSKLNYETST